MITYRRTPVIIKGDDEKVGCSGALLTGLQQSETLGAATSIHDSQGYATRVEKSQSCERFYGPQQYPQSAEDLRVQSVRMVETEPIEQDHESSESGDCPKKGWNSECAEDREWRNIVDTVGGYESTENEEEEIDEGDIFSLYSR